MNGTDIALTIISVLGTISSIIFAFCAKNQAGPWDRPDGMIRFQLPVWR